MGLAIDISSIYVHSQTNSQLETHLGNKLGHAELVPAITNIISEEEKHFLKKKYNIELSIFLLEKGSQSKLKATIEQNPFEE